MFNVGDLVTRKSYNNDTLFKIISIEGNYAYLKGVNVRLYADSSLDDLNKVNSGENRDDDSSFDKEVGDLLDLDRSSYFYLPGKILHIDGDEEYLARCLKFYEKMRVQAYGLTLREEVISTDIVKYLKKLKPDIVVITGHDFFYKNRKDIRNIDNYKNSKYFAEAIKQAREYEKSHDKLFIIAGACQSDYEDLIKAGANFASSPKRVNIHALDPAVIATSIALSSRDKPMDIIKIISRTKYKEEGIGGIITNGTMYTGYPRWI